jgi:nitroreductase
MHAYHSIREYKADPVSDELLAEILEAGIRASSSGNMPTYSIIVTRDLDLRKQLYGPHLEQDMVLDYLESQDFMSGVKVI